MDDIDPCARDIVHTVLAHDLELIEAAIECGFPELARILIRFSSDHVSPNGDVRAINHLSVAWVDYVIAEQIEELTLTIGSRPTLQTAFADLFLRLAN